MAWIDRLPGPVWAFYLAFLVVLVVVVNGVTWIDGSARFGTFDPYRSSVPVYPVAALAFMDYLNRVARRALAAFGPALGASEAEYARFEYELTTLPWRATWVTLGFSLVFTAAYTAFAPSRAEIFSRIPWAAGIDFAIYVIVFGLTVAYVYHTVHQLRVVTRIHASAKNVNLFQMMPLYAFSGLTARTGASLLLLNLFSILTDPATFENLALYGLTVLASIVAAACFVLPLRGMHHRIVAEKSRLSAQVNERLETTIEEIYGRADTKELTGIEQLNRLHQSLVATRDLVAKIPTWPWGTGTLTGFVSAFLLPFVAPAISVLARVLMP